MEIGFIAHELWRLRYWVALGLVAGAVAATSVLYELPSMNEKSYELGAASTEILVEPSGAPLGIITSNVNEVEQITGQTALYARLVGTPPVKQLIGQRAGIPPALIATGRPLPKSTGQESSSEQRGNQLLVEGNKYRILAQPTGEQPLIQIVTQAPTSQEAIRLADSTVAGLRDYVGQVTREAGVPRRLRFRQLGPAAGGLVSEDADKKVAILAFLGGFAAWAAFVLLCSRLRVGWRKAHAAEAGAREAPGEAIGEQDSRFEAVSRQVAEHDPAFVVTDHEPSELDHASQASEPGDVADRHARAGSGRSTSR